MAYGLSAGYAEAYESFLEYIKPRRSVQGYISLRKNTRRILRWFETEEISLDQAGIQDCIRYKNELGSLVKKDGTALSVGTVNNRLKAGKSLFKYLASAGEINADPFREVPYPRMPERISRNVLNEAQTGRLLNRLLEFDGERTAGRRLGHYRLHVISEFLYATGLRISEAAALIPANIDPQSRTVFVPEGKGRKARFAFMTGFASEVMFHYLSRGRKAVLARGNRKYGQTVFGTHPERLMALVNRGLMRECRQLGLPVITSHGFRHSLGTHLLHAGCDMRYIQVILGHESLKTTQVYTRVDKDKLKDSLDTFHPRRWP
ncbi:MAG: tyrosine-type recombinase/integrase [Spirochaetaceae bacterium]|jgi:site-specific recombinase XerD|nr:tyrosine-type recombinase/integrase [Spirochaetaceae bacterium]